MFYHCVCLNFQTFVKLYVSFIHPFFINLKLSNVDKNIGIISALPTSQTTIIYIKKWGKREQMNTFRLSIEILSQIQCSFIEITPSFLFYFATIILII